MEVVVVEVVVLEVAVVEWMVEKVVVVVVVGCGSGPVGGAWTSHNQAAVSAVSRRLIPLVSIPASDCAARPAENMLSCLKHMCMGQTQFNTGKGWGSGGV